MNFPDNPVELSKYYKPELDLLENTKFSDLHLITVE